MGGTSLRWSRFRPDKWLAPKFFVRAALAATGIAMVLQAAFDGRGVPLWLAAATALAGTVLASAGYLMLRGPWLWVDGLAIPVRGTRRDVPNGITRFDTFGLESPSIEIPEAKMRWGGWPTTWRVRRGSGSLYLVEGTRTDASRIPPVVMLANQEEMEAGDAVAFVPAVGPFVSPRSGDEAMAVVLGKENLMLRKRLWDMSKDDPKVQAALLSGEIPGEEEAEELPEPSLRVEGKEVLSCEWPGCARTDGLKDLVLIDAGVVGTRTTAGPRYKARRFCEEHFDAYGSQMRALPTDSVSRRLGRMT